MNVRKNEQTKQEGSIYRVNGPESANKQINKLMNEGIDKNDSINELRKKCLKKG